MLDKEDFDSLHKLIAEPMQAAMKAQSDLLDEKLQSIGRSVDTVREEQTTQMKHCQKMTREMLDFKVGTTIKVANLEKDSAKKDKRSWAIILGVITLGLSYIIPKLFKL